MQCRDKKLTSTEHDYPCSVNSALTSLYHTTFTIYVIVRKSCGCLSCQLSSAAQSIPIDKYYKKIYSFFQFLLIIIISSLWALCNLLTSSHCHKINLTSILNLILKSYRVNIALLRQKLLSKCHKTASIGTLMCFIYTFCLLKSICV